MKVHHRHHQPQATNVTLLSLSLSRLTLFDRCRLSSSDSDVASQLALDARARSFTFLSFVFFSLLTIIGLINISVPRFGNEQLISLCLSRFSLL